MQTSSTDPFSDILKTKELLFNRFFHKALPFMFSLKRLNFARYG